MRGEFAAIAAAFALLPGVMVANAAVVFNGPGNAMTTTTGGLALAANFALTGGQAVTLQNSAGSVTLTVPGSSDTLVGRASTDTLTNKTISGASNTLSNIANAALTNSSVTINGSTVSLGGSTTVTAVASSVQASSGSAGSPSISFSTDTSTGFYRAASSIIGASLGGTRFGLFDANHNFVWGAGSIPAGGAITSATGNFIYGSRAGSAITTASGNFIAGLDAGFNLVAAGSNNSDTNVYIGYTAGKTSKDGGNVGIGHAAMGGSALAGAAVTWSETAIGDLALSMVFASQKDTAVGAQALTVYQRGGQMTAFGRSPWGWLTEGSYGVAIGHASGFFNVGTLGDIYIGNGAGVGNWNGNPTRVTASVTTGATWGTMTVTASNGADTTFAPGMVVVSTTTTGFTTNYVIQPFGTNGTSGTGRTGTYAVLPNNQAASAQTMQAGASTQNNIVIGNNSGLGGYQDQSNIILGNSIVLASAMSNMTVLGGGQTAAYVSGNLSWGLTKSPVSAGSGTTYTAAQTRGGMILRTSAGTVTDTFPGADAIVASIPGCEVGTHYELYIYNGNSGILSVSGGLRVSYIGAGSIGVNLTRLFKVRVTGIVAGSEAVEVWGVPDGLNDLMNASSGITFANGALLSWNDVGLCRLGGGILAASDGGASANANGALAAAQFLSGTASGTYTNSLMALFGPRGNPATSGHAADGIARFGAATGGYSLDIGSTNVPANNSLWLQARAPTDYSVNYDLWLNPNGGLVSIGYTSSQTAKLAVNGTGAFAGAVSIGNTVNAVSPTSPNRTITFVVGGVTLYVAAKTTND